MARSSWTGTLSVAGFPFPVATYNVLKSKSGESFKTLCDCHKAPIRAPKVCAVDGKEIPADRQLKGAEIAPGQFVVIDANALSAKVPASTTLEPAYLAPVETVVAHVAMGVHRVNANPKVPGSDQPVAILWTALRSLGLAMIVEDWTLRAGSRDEIAAIHAQPDGLYANVLPFATDFTDAPASDAPSTAVPQPHVDAMLQTLQAVYQTQDFDRAAHQSKHKLRKDAAVEAATKGEKFTAAPDAPAPEPVPDLMAALKASLANANHKEPVAA